MDPGRPMLAKGGSTSEFLTRGNCGGEYFTNTRLVPTSAALLGIRFTQIMGLAHNDPWRTTTLEPPHWTPKAPALSASHGVRAEHGGLAAFRVRGSRRRGRRIAQDLPSWGVVGQVCGGGGARQYDTRRFMYGRLWSTYRTWVFSCACVVAHIFVVVHRHSCGGPEFRVQACMHANA